MKANRFLNASLHLPWLILLTMAVFMYKERLFADASYYLFHTVNSGWFHVEHGRVVLGLSQVLPLVGYYLHLPLKYLMLLSSVGHELFYYSIFLLLLYGLKDRTSALAVLLIHLIGQLWLYYSPMLEICYGAALAVLLYAILKSGKYKDDKWLILLILAQWFVMTSHLENFLLLAVVLLYDFIKRGFQKRIHLITGGLALLGFIIEILTFSEYELGHVQLKAGAEQASAANLLQKEYVAQLLELFMDYYPDLLLLFLFGVVFFYIKSGYRVLALMVFSTLMLLIVVNQVQMANTFERYYESMYSPLVFIVVFLVLQEFKQVYPKWMLLMTGFVLVISLFRIGWIWKEGETHRLRSAQLERIVDHAQTLGHSKYLINGNNIHHHYTSITWANPIETLLYSAIDGKEQALSIAENNEYYFERNHLKLNDSTYIFRRFEVVSHDFLNPRYFTLKKEAYHYLNSANYAQDPNELKQNVRIEPIAQILTFKAGDTTSILVRINNENQSALPSELNGGVQLSYHWYKEGEVLEWDGLRTAIEVDVTDTYAQHQKIAMPEEAGEYELVFDLVIEGRMWFELKETYPVRVTKIDT